MQRYPKKMEQIPRTRIVLWFAFAVFFLLFLLCEFVAIMRFSIVVASVSGVIGISLLAGAAVILYLGRDNHIIVDTNYVEYNGERYDWTDVRLTVMLSQVTPFTRRMQSYLLFSDHYLSTAEIGEILTRGRGFFVLLDEKRAKELFALAKERVNVMNPVVTYGKWVGEIKQTALEHNRTVIEAQNAAKAAAEAASQAATQAEMPAPIVEPIADPEPAEKTVEAVDEAVDEPAEPEQTETK